MPSLKSPKSSMFFPWSWMTASHTIKPKGPHFSSHTHFQHNPLDLFANCLMLWRHATYNSKLKSIYLLKISLLTTIFKCFMMYPTVTELLRKVLKILGTSNLYLEIKNIFFSSCGLPQSSVINEIKCRLKINRFFDVKWRRLGHSQFGFCR